MDGLEKLKPVALLLLRVGLGVIFVFHGYPKLFTHTRDAIAAFTKMGFPGYFAYLAGVIEFFGGCMLIVGLFTRVAGLFLFLEMAVALVKVHQLLANPMAVDVYQFPLALAVGSLALAAVGGGIISIDHAVAGGGGGVGPRRPSKKPKGGGKDRE
jgi:putative oxidoreductase